MRKIGSRGRGVLAAASAIASIGAAVALGFAGVSYAAQPTDSGDPRANGFLGNAKTCAEAGLGGEIVPESDIDFTITGDDKQFLNITDVDDEWVVTGIVVKGADRYNVYIPGAKGLSADPPWLLLQSALKNDKAPQISHWFVCANEDTTTTTTTTTEPTTTTTTDTTTTTTTTTDETTTTETTTEPTTPATTTTVAGTSLPVTGAGVTSLIPVGALLLVGGGAALWLARARRSA